MAKWLPSLNQVLGAHNSRRAHDSRTVSHETRTKRAEVLEKGFRDLQKLGFKLDTVHQFKERHMTALGNQWESQGLASKTIQDRVSIFRTFSEWVGKKGMIRESHHYVTNPESVKVSSGAKTDKTWSGHGVDLQAKVTEVAGHDPRVAIQLELQESFGLRAKESWMLQPRLADEKHYLTLTRGTKNGRPRTIPIRTTHQRDVLERAKMLAERPIDSTMPPDKTLKQWKNHYYHIVRSHRITRKADGVTSHGLRHEHLNRVYEQVAGHRSPIKGGLVVDRELDQAARQVVAQVSGHSRPSISSKYVGNRRG